jgi:hypothetical protein
MIALRKSESFMLDSPLAEPDVRWNPKDKYITERVVDEHGSIIWFGYGVNWKKEKGGKWGVLTTNKDAKPLEKYLPEIVYGEDRTYFKECETPLYELMYEELKYEKSCLKES